MKRVYFSIIVPVYNVQDYLEECLQSVLSQEDTLYECILIDDGSTDQSGAICDEYAACYECVKVVHQKNKGLSGARNTGIRMAEGEYLIFLDSDDMLCKDALKNLEQAVTENTDASIIVNRRETYDMQQKTRRECAYQFDIQKLIQMSNWKIYKELQKLSDCWLGVWIFCLERKYLCDNELWFYDGILHEDEEWVPRVILNAEKIGFNNKCLYCNRINREGSITATPNIKRMFDVLLIIELLQQEFKKEKYTIEIQKVVEERIRSIYFGILCNFTEYALNEQYSELLNKIAENKLLLRKARKTSHKIGYFFVSFIGLTATGKILFNLKKYFGRE